MSLMEARLTCPACLEAITVVVDPMMVGQSFTEDCSVCCRPLVLCAQQDDNGELEITSRKENE